MPNVTTKEVDMQTIKCAIYVRKSSERGLDMEFNSLQNQEEACRNYILSQTFQGWEYARTYSDGGISGGTMARPGLQQMLEDIRAGNIQCVLVYKVDRLSRSIYDFKRMMKEIFEKHDCNLVSITQSFDTSTAMGKLTLNMLLSFAEFEREVASERVKDKMRATKAKGMWVGGILPIGYDLNFGKLVVNEKEANEVRIIYETYLESESLSDCKQNLINKGIYSKSWVTRKGIRKGGSEIGVSSLQKILTNKLYLGKMPNKSTDEVFNGLHVPIIDEELFNKVQDKLKQNNVHGDAPYSRGQSLLHNKIYTVDGHIMKNKKGTKGQKTYRYYKYGNISVPAGDIEEIIKNTLNDFLNSTMDCISINERMILKHIKFDQCIIQPMIEKIVYNQDKVSIFIKIHNLDNLVTKDYFNNKSDSMNYSVTEDGKYVVVDKPIYRSTGTCINHRCDGCEVSILTKSENTQTLIKALAYGWKYKQEYESGMPAITIAKNERRDKRTIYKYLNLTYLSPRIVTDIMNDCVPSGITLQKLFTIASKYNNFQDQEQVFYSV